MGNGDPIDIEELAAGYDEKRQMDPADFERLLGLIARQSEVGGRVLEVGCGTGFHLVPLAQQLPETYFYGIEPADAMLAQARVKARETGISNCCLARADAHALPFPEDTFDLILMSQVIHFFSDKTRAAAEVHRVSREGASLIVITTSHSQLRCQVDLSFFPGLIERELVRIPPVTEIKSLFEGLGFGLYNTTEFAATFSAPSADAMVEEVAGKPWSSYLLFTEVEFQRGLKDFRGNLRDVFGNGEITYLVPQTLLFFRRD
ncbi:class I SAM-dependent methyltransferase [Chloroflexota bacterium]